MSRVMHALRYLEAGESLQFTYSKGRFVDPFFLGRGDCSEDSSHKCKFGHLGRYHGGWTISGEYDVDEVKVQL